MSGREVFVEHLNDGRFSIRMGKHELEVQQHSLESPLEGGPGPTELFVASLVSCIAFYARGFLNHYDLAERVRVSARWSLTSKPMRISRIVVEIEAPLLPEKLYDPLRSVVQKCTVHNTLTHAPEISFEISAGRPTTSRST
jgi:putative redox protein